MIAKSESLTCAHIDKKKIYLNGLSTLRHSNDLIVYSINVVLNI